MTKREYTPAQAEAAAKYDKATYKMYSFKLRKEDDADIIESIEESKANGINKRQWLRDLFEGK